MARISGKWRARLLDLLERAGWSAGQVFFATLVAGGTAAATLPWRYALTLGLSAAVFSLVVTIAQYLTKLSNLPYWVDLGVRLAKTFLGSLVGSFAAGKVFDITAFDWKTAFNVAVVATLSALAKGLLAREPAAAGPGPGAPPRQSGMSPSTLPLTTYAEAVEP